ncbi:MAG: hypothetical protein EOP06_13380 [Proteobacteria bacterium]|nr:MAG: hypothetical protein EOP06_13380 [Pseudomonadota bacterium]
MFYFRRNRYILKSIQTSEPVVYLTFDDGPDADFTPRVLDMLGRFSAKASFFVVGTKAILSPQILERMQQEKHAIFSHSVDHRYDNFFSSYANLRAWVLRSQNELQQLVQAPKKAFRPPAGILTPPLIRVATEEQIPLVLWNHRFYDTVRPWSPRKAIKSAQNVRPGDIVLLHDRQKAEWADTFLRALDLYLSTLSQKGFRFEALSEDLLLAQTKLTPKT